MFHKLMPTSLEKLKQVLKKNWQKFFHNNVRDWQIIKKNTL